MAFGKLNRGGTARATKPEPEEDVKEVEVIKETTEEEPFVEPPAEEKPKPKPRAKAKVKVKVTPEAKAIAKKSTGKEVAVVNPFALATGVDEVSSLILHGDDPLESDFEGFIFPTIVLTGGNSGGTFAPHASYEESNPGLYDALDDVIKSKKVPCRYLGHRTTIVAWPLDYEDKGPDDKPIWDISIPDKGANDLFLLMRKACSKYKWTAKEKRKTIYDIDEDGEGIGHVKPMIEILVWIPGLDTAGDGEEDSSLAVIQLPAHYDTMDETYKNFVKIVEKSTNSIPTAAATLVASTEEKSTTTFDWSIHSVELISREDSEEETAAFQAYLGDLSADEESMEMVTGWLSGENIDDDNSVEMLNRAATVRK